MATVNIRIGLVALFWPRVEAGVYADYRKMEKENRSLDDLLLAPKMAAT